MIENSITDEKIEVVHGGKIQYDINKKRCIGCGMCKITCPINAISISNNFAIIDSNKCNLCGKCANACPTGAISKNEVAQVR